MGDVKSTITDRNRHPKQFQDDNSVAARYAKSIFSRKVLKILIGKKRSKSEKVGDYEQSN
jgi:hypothetical protein